MLIIFPVFRFGGRGQRSWLIEAISNYFQHFDAATRINRALGLVFATIAIAALFLLSIIVCAGVIGLGGTVTNGNLRFLGDVLLLGIIPFFFVATLFLSCIATHWYCRAVRVKSRERTLWIAAVVLTLFVALPVIPLTVLVLTTGDKRRRAITFDS